MNHAHRFSKSKPKLNFETDRQGVTVVLFAILLPVLLLLATIAINIAHMQLTRTELKIATDASARAGGRAWSEFNDLDRAKEFAREAAELNTVSGRPLILSTSESDGQMVFGESIRNGDGRFEFTPASESEFESGTVLASGFQVNATHEIPLFFAVNGIDSFTPSASSITTQVDRDIALVLDRSGSMFSFEGRVTDPGQGEDFLFNTLTELYDDPANEITREEYIQSIAEYQSVPEAAEMSPLDRQYSSNILDLLSGDLKNYALSVNADYHTRISAPKLSRWDSLEIATQVFFDVLDTTDQTEFVSIVSFASNARVDATPTPNLAEIRPIIAGVFPDGGTAIGDGMIEGFAALNTSDARIGTVKTVIVMTDGINRRGVKPIAAANQIIADNPNTIINTVTFGAEADITDMVEVARIGSGRHFHASNAQELTEVFRDLASVHRTLITQ